MPDYTSHRPLSNLVQLAGSARYVCVGVSEVELASPVYTDKRTHGLHLTFSGLVMEQCVMPNYIG